MKKNSTDLRFVTPLILACTIVNVTFAQRTVSKDVGAVAAIPRPSTISVSKTAHVDGHNVCGTIRITNNASTAATVTAVVDYLEVHFPRSVPPPDPAPPAGSTPGWYKVANVVLSVSLPLSIGSRATESIDYCTSLCDAIDSPGANTMRNVVTVTATISGRVTTVTTRSVSFPPPVLDCRACCKPDGSCVNTVPADCESAGGLPQAAGSDCATTECPEACCRPDDECTYEGPSACRDAAGEPQGAGTDCDTTQCCEPLGEDCFSALDCCETNARCVEDTCCLELAETGCTERSHCCEESGTVALCEEGRCCAPNRARDSCHDTADCCDENATCSGRTCCIALGDIGCTNSFGNDCCETFGTAICDSGKCCAPTGSDESCNADSDCCDPNATCVLDGNDPGTCCIPLGVSVCEDSSDCCDEGNGFVVCDAGKCCAPSGSFSSCSADADCCVESETCNPSGVCCVAIGEIGCNTPGAHCCDYPGSTLFCNEAGRCCGLTGIPSACVADTDCCDPKATCNGGTCCIETGNLGCEDVSDCCNDRPGMVCEDQKCCVRTDVDFHSACSDATDCCQLNATCNIHGACCIATGTLGCFTDSHCCDSGSTCDLVTGKCCAENSGPGICDDSTDCCDGNAICNLNSTCCVPDLRPCNQHSNCCSGLCTGGACEGIIGP